MPTEEEERDEKILEIIIKAYEFEWDQKEKIDTKLNNFVAIATTVATLNTGVGFFVLERVPSRNPYFIPLVVTLVIGVALFVLSVIVSLLGYRPLKYQATPRDTLKIIDTYKTLKKAYIIREVATTMAEATNWNMQINKRKAKMLQLVFWILASGALSLVVFTICLSLALGTPVIDP
jgi:hypothetical protein